MEDITVPYFFEGKTFGYTCIKIVNPAIKKKKQGVKEYWVIADSSDAICNLSKQEVVATWNGKRFKFLVLRCLKNNITCYASLVPHIVIGGSGEVYINLAAYKNYQKLFKPPAAPVTAKEDGNM